MSGDNRKLVRSYSHWSRRTIKRLEQFCRNCSYLYRFNCITTVYIDMNCIGIVFGNRFKCLQTLVGWVIYSISFVITVKFVRLICNLNKLQLERKFTIIILVLNFVVMSI